VEDLTPYSQFHQELAAHLATPGEIQSSAGSIELFFKTTKAIASIVLLLMSLKTRALQIPTAAVSNQACPRKVLRLSK
jgi:hypothetical protein